MASHVYEGMFILDSNRYGRDPDGVSGQISQIIQKAGGEMLVSRLWEERRLAYPIKGQRKGTYWLTYFRIEGEHLTGIARQFRLSESVLRHLFVMQDPRIIETLVAHALAGEPGAGGRVAGREAADEKAESAEKQGEAAAAEGAPEVVGPTDDSP